MDKIFLIILFGITTVFIILAIKKQSSDYALAISICAGCIIILFVISDILEIITFISSVIEYGQINGEWAGSIGKIALISFAGQWGIQICRDAGENSIADKMETAVKILVLIICLPYINMIFKMAAEIS